MGKGWIPAYAGMTVAGGGLHRGGVWIPAFAGMTVEVGQITPGWGVDSRFRGNDGGRRCGFR